MNQLARAELLAAVADALRGTPRTEALTGTDEELEHAADPSVLAALFKRELEAVDGRAELVATLEELPAAIREYAGRVGLQTFLVGVSDLARLASSLLDGARPADAGIEARDVEAVDCALIEADALLADTGSALVLARTRGERLLPYLPRACIVVARGSALHATLTSAALRVAFAAARSGVTGEAVMVTGPSRTADIEKTMVLGAHGPRTVMVFIVGACSPA